jgi:hypothetical protein
VDDNGTLDGWNTEGVIFPTAGNSLIIADLEVVAASSLGVTFGDISFLSSLTLEKNNQKLTIKSL